MNCDYERTLSNGRTGFPEFLESMEAFLEETGAPVAVVTKFMIAFDELVSNILNHGSAATISARIFLKESEVAAELIDDGDAFDPLSLPDPDTSLSVEDRPIGGLGVHIVRSLMDHVDYSREGNCNRLRFAKNYPVDL
ncbi:ATP-binding protein [Novosphingobium album (ex Hu et al. 2023)]|uniref:ATP-binding protein n=1 Tax=Novosphingobium album (ex Hu et al. 2023) TaxID=2930093 RepID=A0ABT0AXP2_9SPHN|nr:ATP-binding protein [Novosphingobium album (ex Hu et al. 2023)]MCJ2177489.1 ATP-binding protein [Novosphingobium album (ex Hu et al. 2023)]